MAETVLVLEIDDKIVPFAFAVQGGGGLERRWAEGIAVEYGNKIINNAE